LTGRADFHVKHVEEKARVVRRKVADLPAVVEAIKEQAAAVEERSLGEIEFEFRPWKGPKAESWATFRQEALAEFEKVLVEYAVRAGLNLIGE
jgi:hypothetical protein